MAVGDVAGKATPAALLGSMAVGLMRGQVVERPLAPAEMLAELNEQLRAPGIDNRFVAMLYGVYESRRKTLTLGSAGFPRPLLVRDGRVEEVPVGGVPLGMLAGTRYEEKALELRRGDVLALCSDGLIECPGDEGEALGLDRTKETLRRLATGHAQEIADGIEQAASEVVEKQADDRTVVILKVR